MRAICFASTALCAVNAHSNNLDGQYKASFDFKMGGAAICKEALPIEIIIDVNDRVITGRIENKSTKGHPYCRSYHEGDITGKLEKDGSFFSFKIVQDDFHSSQYSSYRVAGSLSGATLLSRSSKFHPDHKFQFVKPNELAALLISTQSAPAQPVALAPAQPVAAAPAQPVAAAPAQPVAVAPAQPVATAQPVLQSGPTSTQVQAVNRIMSPAEAQVVVDEVQARIRLFSVIVGVIKEKPRTRQERILSIVDGEIARLRAEKAVLESLLTQRFSTPIRPTNSNLSVSAFRAADTFPKIPYYVPGTNEFGEMLVVPRVSDEGALTYQFDFIDPVSTYAKVRDRIDVPHEEIETLILGLDKVDEWTTVAQENNITRRVSKTASCFPQANCGDRAIGKSSTEVLFQIYEDGSTAGRIQRNKGQYVVGYNMSVESSILLSAYLLYMQEAGAKEFNIGVMTDDQVLELFN